MSRLVLVLGFLFATQASQVKVNSFRFGNLASQRSPVAEICGQLITPTGNAELIKILVDPDTKGPASYNTWTGKDGKFCHIIASYTGKALVDIAE